MTQRPGFPGLKDGCKWCLCVNRYISVTLQYQVSAVSGLTRIDGRKPSLHQNGWAKELCLGMSSSSFAARLLDDQVLIYFRVDLNATALDSLKTLKMEDLQRFATSK